MANGTAETGIMLPFTLGPGGRRPLHVLCLGAHPDDIEIGCGGTMLRMREAHPELRVTWVVFSGDGPRAQEARRGAELFLDGLAQVDVRVHGFRDGFFPYDPTIKDSFETLKGELEPDVVFTHYGMDLHQDHRLISQLTWNTFRHHLVLEYEIPKFDGGLGSPNVFIAVSQDVLRRKVDHLMSAFGTQRDKGWFTESTFSGLMRLRGIEAAASEGYAEGFYVRKLLLQP
jgi:LmbE family N-acetylglucosaminyl deacetylase